MTLEISHAAEDATCIHTSDVDSRPGWTPPRIARRDYMLFYCKRRPVGSAVLLRRVPRPRMTIVVTIPGDSVSASAAVATCQIGSVNIEANSARSLMDLSDSGVSISRRTASQSGQEACPTIANVSAGTYLGLSLQRGPRRRRRE